MTPTRGTLHVFDDAQALAFAVAEWFADLAESSQGRFVAALSGGSTPKPLYQALAQPRLADRFPWQRSYFVLGDERFVPPTDDASNFKMINGAMLNHVKLPPDHMLAVPTETGTPEQAAAAYQLRLQQLYGAERLDPARPLLDVCFLGLGDDGHTASLIPGEPVIAERDRWVAAVGHGRAEPRVTLTFPALESSANVAFLVSGQSKRTILDRVLGGDDTVPAGQLRPHGDILWFVDRAAAGSWAA